MREERQYIMKVCKAIAKTGCNVLLIQKSVLRDATNDLALHFLAKLKIMCVRDIERTDADFICKTLGCTPAAVLEQFTAAKLGTAVIAEETNIGGDSSSKVLRILTRVPTEDEMSDVMLTQERPQAPPTGTVSILLRGSNLLVLDEADRSFHDALCVVRSLVKKRAMI